MSSRPKKKRSTKKQPSRQDYELEQAYHKLVTLVEQAKHDTSPGAPANLQEAGHFLAGHPQLMSFLQAAQERELARQDALTRRLDQKSSPTGAHPQDYMAGWTNSKDTPIGVPNARLLRDWADSNEWTR